MSAHSAACTKGWPAGRRSHCAACCESFTTPANFDAHRDNGECLNPAKVGLVQSDKGYWQMPGREEE